MLLNKYTIAGLAVLAAAGVTQAQPTAHYVPGVEGIKGASLPPPGFYFRDYNVFYFADQANNPDGNKIHGLDADAFIYANVPRFVWITDAQVLGGHLGVDALIPLQQTSLEFETPLGKFEDEHFGVGDLFVEGTWSKHAPKYDLSLGYGIWAPTANSSLDHPARPGLGFWTHMFTFGGTYYPDAEKKWSVSALSRYEINHEDMDTDTTPGHAYTLEWGIARALCKTAEAGVVGYYQQQVSLDSGSGASNHRDMVAAVGPEITALIPEIQWFVSLRYLYEFIAEDRLQGHTVALTLTKRF